MARIGYARVSTGEQTTAGQLVELRAAGCARIHEEHASGGSRDRPVLNRLLHELRPGDTLVIVRLDRLARSLSHLLDVIETLEARGVGFKSLNDPVDTSSPESKFTLQVLGAAAELERSLIRNRTVAGLKAARKAGRIGGNPGLRSGDKEAIRKITRARDDAHFAKLEETATQWVPEVRRLRPGMPWEDVTRMINTRLDPGVRPWTKERLVRAVKRYVKEGFLEKDVLSRAPRRRGSGRLLAIVAGIKGAAPGITLQEIAAQLEKMREPTPRGRSKWQVSSVKMLLDRAEREGMLGGQNEG